MPTLTVYRHASVSGSDTPESPTYLGDWRAATSYEKESRPDDYLWLDLMGGSDYSGNALERSNHDVFLEQFGTVDGVLDVYGGFGTYGVLIRRDVYDSNEDIREQIDRLENYPALDDEHMSGLEVRAQDEAWESWACADFRHALGKRFPDLEDAINDIDSADLQLWFQETAADQGRYWENETGNSAWIDVEDVAKDVDESALRDFLAAHAESPATA